MIHYYPNPISITEEMEKTILRNQRQDAKEQQENPEKIYWWERNCEVAE